MRTELFLNFPDRNTMLAVASALVGYAVENPAVDGWLVIDPETGEEHYWNLCELGVLYAPGPDLDAEGNPIPVALDGWHVNGLWRGPEETVPAALQQYRIYPETPAVVFG